ncbi:CRP-like cAMP-binding protein [Amorphus orientalis]|uniref:CRP-like cAMP-binding protein n=1 Tax=Amorphus orientalis TaxID=649198 RepID=A0AAE3VQL4_9HYPH|nr:CRP-like cAMP-binding protein [Amorphus orientalis]
MDHGIEALTGMVLCLFPRTEFMALYKNQPSLGYDVTWLAAEQERLLDAQLVTVGRRTAIERVAFVVWYLFDRGRELGMVKNGRMVFPLTQQHMADTLGLSLVHTNKTIKRLRSTGTVRWSERWLEIEDEARLMEIANVEQTARPKRPFI